MHRASALYKCASAKLFPDKAYHRYKSRFIHGIKLLKSVGPVLRNGDGCSGYLIDTEIVKTVNNLIKEVIGSIRDEIYIPENIKETSGVHLILMGRIRHGLLMDANSTLNGIIYYKDECRKDLVKKPAECLASLRALFRRIRQSTCVVYARLLMTIKR